jgi:hypothetical protein
LTRPNVDPDLAVQIDELTRQLAGKFQDDRVLLELARNAAEAEFDRKRARRTRLALMERTAIFGSLDPPKFFRTPFQEVKWVIKMQPWISGQRLHGGPRVPKVIDPSTTMPTQALDRIAEGTRRILREFVKLERYEARAISRRDRAIRAMMARAEGQP